MTQGLKERDIFGLYFTADQKAVTYIHLAQFYAPNYEPAINAPPDPNKQKLRGGSRKNTPWPQDQRMRIHAVSQIIDKWWKMGLVNKERPWLDGPMWLWVNAVGLRRLGLDYNDVHFYDEVTTLHHLNYITDIRLRLARRPEDQNAAWFKYTWISERTLKASYPQNTLGETLPHLPDGVLELEEDALVKMAFGDLMPFKRRDRIAIEVELSRKDFSRLEAILPDLLKHFSGVWYFCEQKAYDAVVITKQKLVAEGILTNAQARLIRVIHLEE